jgi:replicative DNA helicase
MKHYANLYYASSSERLARDVQALLLRLDLNATLRRVPQGDKGLDQFQVWISGREEILRFLDSVGGLGANKELHAASIRQHLAERTPNTNRDVIPKEAWASIVKPARTATGLTERTFQEAIGTAYCGSTLYKSNMSRERALRVADVLGSEDLARLAASDVYWDEILSIEPDGEEEVYDLTVDGLHNFVANDIVVHNSIEQDADIVMFIYRDEYYNPDSDKKATAEVIVAKHRNGPVGQVDLYFEKNLTKFQSITSRPFAGPA